MTASAAGSRSEAAAGRDTPSPFDAMAHEYDSEFTDSAIGRIMRNAVWRRLDERFSAGDRIIDLGCGTGEDAIHLAQRGMDVLAIDSSAAMVDSARAKVEAARMTHRVVVEQRRIEDLDGSISGFDGAVSNFGGLNCVEDVAAFAGGLGRSIRSGGFVLICVMGPIVPWEFVWFLCKGDPRRAFRRLSRDGTKWRGLTIRYPSIRAAAGAFQPYFRLVRVWALGALIPPPYASSEWNRHSALLHGLDRIERQLESIPPFPSLADHYVLELERR